MELALIPPLCRLDDIKKTSYQMVLPCNAWSQKHNNAYRAAAARGDYLILDNGAAEGDQVSVQDLMAIAGSIGCQEIIIPDIIGDMRETIKKLMQFESIGHTHKEFKYMAVIQGTTVKQTKHMIDAIHDEFPWVYSLGFPRHLLTAIDHHVRMNLTKYVTEKYHNPWPIHFLGTKYRFPLEIKVASKIFQSGEIRGVDSSSPYVFANAGWYFDNEEILRRETRSLPTARPENYFSLPESSFPSAEVNVELMKQYAHG